MLKNNNLTYDNNSCLELLPGEIHLWVVFLDEINDVDLLKKYYELMTSEERRCGDRFRFAKHRHQYVVTRALVRTTLSKYCRTPPHQWLFNKNQYGRPEIDSTQNSLGLKFNLSHADGMIVCGVIRDVSVWDVSGRDVSGRDVSGRDVSGQDVHGEECTIGADVENIDRKCGSIAIGERFFSEYEAADLRHFSNKERQLRFFEYWTLKEAYIKACGMGLSIPLKQFSFHITRKAPLTISFAPELNDDPKSWRFWLIKPTKSHQIALAVRFKTKSTCQPVIKKVTPLLAEQALECSIIQ